MYIIGMYIIIRRLMIRLRIFDSRVVITRILVFFGIRWDDVGIRLGYKVGGIGDVFYFLF